VIINVYLPFYNGKNTDNAHKYQEDIQKAQQLIKIATGIAYKYSDIPEKLDEFEDKKSIDYQDDFMENTYFSGRH
jgi:hypothetical protein